MEGVVSLCLSAIQSSRFFSSSITEDDCWNRTFITRSERTWSWVRWHLGHSPSSRRREHWISLVRPQRKVGHRVQPNPRTTTPDDSNYQEFESVWRLPYVPRDLEKSDVISSWIFLDRATKLIAWMYQIEIIIRDANRIHHFHKNGQCSCQDHFWFAVPFALALSLYLSLVSLCYEQARDEINVAVKWLLRKSLRWNRTAKMSSIAWLRDSSLVQCDGNE